MNYKCQLISYLIFYSDHLKQSNVDATNIFRSQKVKHNSLTIEAGKVIKMNKKKSADRKIVKILISLTILFVLSYIPMILRLTKVIPDFSMMYVYFINHCGNPIIYFSLDDYFRKEMKIIANKFKCWK